MTTIREAERERQLSAIADQLDAHRDAIRELRAEQARLVVEAVRDGSTYDEVARWSRLPKRQVAQLYRQAQRTESSSTGAQR